MCPTPNPPSPALPELTGSAAQLYAWLPAYYRERDRLDAQGHLGHYLAACGVLLDRIRATLDQRLADAFAEPGLDGRSCQPWLLPYLAQQFDATLYATDEAGQRREVAQALAWRQRKGTLSCAQEIAEALLHRPVVLHEGWTRVATTPRVGNHRPAAVLADLSRPQAALQGPHDAGACLPNPAPRRPGAHDDTCRRTVDVRAPGQACGQIHPRRLLVHASPPAGLTGGAAPHEVKLKGELTPQDIPLRAVREGARLTLSPKNHQRITLWTTSETLSLRLLLKSWLPVLMPGNDPKSIDELVLNDVNLAAAVVRDGSVAHQRLRLVRCAVERLDLSGPDPADGQDQLVATDCLLGDIKAPRQRLQLEYCTVLGSVSYGRLHASDCVFAGTLQRSTQVPPMPVDTLRYCRVDPAPQPVSEGLHLCHEVPRFHRSDLMHCLLPRLETLRSEFLRLLQTVVLPPTVHLKLSQLLPHMPPLELLTSPLLAGLRPKLESTVWTRALSAPGLPGCGLLHPDGPTHLHEGAEDGCELGVDHHLAHVRQHAALAAKLAEHLPVGITPVLLFDNDLPCAFATPAGDGA